MKGNWNKGRRWAGGLLAAGALVFGGYFGLTTTGIWAASAADTATAAVTTVTIQPADLAATTVSASGNLALIAERNVTLAAGGAVENIAVAVGDQVQAGDLLLALDTTELERTLALAQLQIDAAKLALADLQTPATDAELAQAQSALLEAQENLAEVQAGPSSAELAAAQSSLAAAQSGYAELQAGPSEAELTQLSADMKKAEIALAEAQSAYD
jgi:multidrug efflux pump subunit AcrA (membrane-fusion protein)